MLHEKMQAAMNKQVNAELYSAYLYLAMAGYFESVNLQGMANWLRAQAGEEMFHAMKFFNFIAERGGRVVLAPIEGPPRDWPSPLAAFEAAYGHEQKITGLINDLVNLALEIKDHASNNMLQWFVAEQVEEESSTDQIVQKLKLIGEDRSGLFLLDRELATRTFVWPPAAAAKAG